jgi:polyphosphate kinase 2
MAKHGKHDQEEPREPAPPGVSPAARMKNKEYEPELRRLHGELVSMQEWVKDTGAKVCIVFEGRDTAGKGGTIKAITERVSPRVFRVVALPAPTEREKSQMYIQRYVPHLPAAGEVVIFDRSWYNRAGVERVMGFCTEDQARRFLEQVPAVERAMVDSGILLTKYWLEVSPDEQTRRLESRIDDPRKIWKLSGMDLASYTRWDDYSRMGTVVRRPDRRQEACTAQRHQPPVVPGSLRAAPPREGRTPQARGAPRRRSHADAVATHRDDLLNDPVLQGVR